MNKITLEALQVKDAKLIFEWRNDPFIVSLGSQNKKVLWDEHIAWINEAVASKTKKTYIILLEGVPVGQARFDRETEETKSCVLSIYVLEKYTGKGIGVESIKLACNQIQADWFEIDSVNAFVLKHNVYAQRGFLKAGFKRVETKDDKHELYVYCLHGLIPHNRITFDDEEIHSVERVIRTGYWAGGESVENLEQELRNITGRARAVAVSSGLSALRISLLSLDIGSNDEVIIPAYSCVALANAVLAVGAIPVPVDVNNSDFNIDVEDVVEKITDKTKAIIAVHTFGAIANIPALKQYNIPVIEDCAHALGVKMHFGTVGNMGDIAICSFYATKLIGGGEGGAILTNNTNIAQVAYDCRDYTDKPPSGKRLNDKLSNVHAALSLVQLRKLPEFIKRRREIANIYFSLFNDLKIKHPRLMLPIKDEQRIWYRFPIVLQDITADNIIDEMEKMNVAVKKPVELWISNLEDFPQSVRAFRHIISLPLYPNITTLSQERVVKALDRVLSK